MTKKLILAILCISPHFLFAQINPEAIQIARDKWGVPHIFAKTDEEVAYGQAWVICEDDFNSVQEHLLASRNQLAKVKGKDGAILDLIVHLIGAKELVDSAFHEKAFSPKFRKVMRGYVQGLNDYARKHPKELLLKGLFPMTEKDLLKSYVFNFALFSGMDDALTKVFRGTIAKDENLPTNSLGGSNAFAVSRKITADGKTYLNINSHQPLEGPFSWYEAHLCSEEGWNMLGGIIPGGVSIGHGVNPYLGWAHTVNSADFTDVYKLEMNPNSPLQYKFDGNWETLTERPIKLKVKVGMLTFGKKFTTYWSKYGATVKTERGFYALRFAANMSIRMPEQHYWMNKAKNFEDFKKALELQAINCFNIVYADRDDNIFYISNGLIPYRDKSYNWAKVLPGNTSKTLWANKFHPLNELPQVLNPNSGYVFNANNTPFNATSAEDNLKAENYNATMGYELYNTNRSLRLSELLKPYNSANKLSYDGFKRIKYDVKFSNPLYSFAAVNLEDLMKLDAKKYPDLTEIMEKFQKWDRTAEIDNEEVTIFMLIQQFFFKKLRKENRNESGNKISEAEMIEAFRFAQSHLKKNFGTIHVPLGKIQFHVRGKKELPMRGIFDVIAAMYSIPYKKGTFRTYQGESYISLVRFSKEGIEVETVNAYGATNHKESPHYNDQMEMYSNKQLKPMSFDKEKILKEAERVYHPK